MSVRRDELDSVTTSANQPPLTVAQILSWADAHHAATGGWPTHRTGRVLHGPRNETWHHINLALARGFWGLPLGGSLAWLLQEHRQVKPRVSKEVAQARAQVRRRLEAERPDGPRALTVEQILAWADGSRGGGGQPFLLFSPRRSARW